MDALARQGFDELTAPRRNHFFYGKLLDHETTAVLGMATHELLENALKYSIEASATFSTRIEPCAADAAGGTSPLQSFAKSLGSRVTRFPEEINRSRSGCGC